MSSSLFRARLLLQSVAIVVCVPLLLSTSSAWQGIGGGDLDLYGQKAPVPMWALYGGINPMEGVKNVSTSRAASNADQFQIQGGYYPPAYPDQGFQVQPYQVPQFGGNPQYGVQPFEMQPYDVQPYYNELHQPDGPQPYNVVPQGFDHQNPLLPGGPIEGQMQPDPATGDSATPGIFETPGGGSDPAAVAEAASKLAEANALVESLRNDQQRMQEEMKSLAEQLNAANARSADNTAMNQQATELRDQNRALDERARAAERQVEAAEQRAREAMAGDGEKMQVLEKELAVQREINDAMESQLEQNRAEMTTARQAVEQMTKQLGDAEIKLVQSDESAKALEANLKEKIEKNLKTKLEKEVKKDLEEDLKKEIEKDLRNDLEKEVKEEMKAELKESDTAMAGMKKALAEKEKLNTDQKKKIEILAAETEKLRAAAESNDKKDGDKKKDDKKKDDQKKDSDDDLNAQIKKLESERDRQMAQLTERITARYQKQLDALDSSDNKFEEKTKEIEEKRDEQIENSTAKVTARFQKKIDNLKARRKDKSDV